MLGESIDHEGVNAMGAILRLDLTGTPTAWLSREIDWPGTPGEAVAVFTGRADVEPYRQGLAGFGLTRIERL